MTASKENARKAADLFRSLTVVCQRGLSIADLEYVGKYFTTIREFLESASKALPNERSPWGGKLKQPKFSKNQYTKDVTDKKGES